MEPRYPFVDQSFVEFILSVPASQLLRPGQRRSLMRRALGDLLPSEVLSRQTKGTAGRRHMASLEAHWGEIQKLVTTALTSQLGYINKDAFERALADVKKGKLNQLIVMMRGVALELWLRQVACRGIIHVDGGPAMSVRRELASTFQS